MAEVSVDVGIQGHWPGWDGWKGEGKERIHAGSMQGVGWGGYWHFLSEATREADFPARVYEQRCKGAPRGHLFPLDFEPGSHTSSQAAVDS